MLECNDNCYDKKASLAHVIYRQVKESAMQRLMLDACDIDTARNLEPVDLEVVSKNTELTHTSAPKGTVYHIGLN